MERSVQESRAQGRELLVKMETCSAEDAKKHADELRKLVQQMQDNPLFPELSDLEKTLEKSIQAAQERDAKK